MKNMSFEDHVNGRINLQIHFHFSLNQHICRNCKPVFYSQKFYIYILLLDISTREICQKLAIHLVFYTYYRCI